MVPLQKSARKGMTAAGAHASPAGSAPPCFRQATGVSPVARRKTRVK